MLDEALKDALKNYMASLTTEVTLRVMPGEDVKREELIQMLQDVVALSPKLHFEEGAIETPSLASPITFELLSDGKSRGVIFSGVPGGHEFNSFILAILHLGGVAIKLDEALQDLVRSIQQPLRFQTVVALSCHSCPDVVQVLNQMAIINPNITHEMIDGGLYPEFIESHKIQGVPSVLLNGQAFANGQVDAAVIIKKLKEKELIQVDTQRPEKSMALQDVTIIGGGPAGVAAGVYAARKGLKVTLVAERFGGQVKDTMGIENLISVPYITGPELTGKMRTHLEQHAIQLKEHFKVEKVSQIENTELFPKPLQEVQLSSGEHFLTKTLIVATGARWRTLGIPGEIENIGQGVAYCPHCDGPFFKGKRVAVIGGGNSGVEAALDLSGIAEHVTLFEFMPSLKADQVLVDQLYKKTNIDVKTNTATQEILAEQSKVTAIRYQDRASEQVETLPLAGVFVQIGLLPNSEFLKGQIEMNAFGEIVIDDRCKTSIPGVYAAGDVSTVPYKQIIISKGEGSKAALSAFEYLLKSGS